MSDAAQETAAAAAAKAEETLRGWNLRRAAREVQEEAQAQVEDAGALLATTALLEQQAAAAEIAKKRSKKALAATKVEQEEELLDLLLLLCREEVVMPLASCSIQWMPLQRFLIEHYVVLREARHRQFCSNAEWKSAGWKGGVQLKKQWTKKQLVLAGLLKEVDEGGKRRLPVSLPRASKALADAFGTDIRRYSTGSECIIGAVFMLNSGVKINQWPAKMKYRVEDLFDHMPKRESWLELRAVKMPPGGSRAVNTSSHGYLKYPKPPESVTGGGRSADGKHKTTQDKTTQLTVAVHPKVALFTKRKVVCALNSGLLYTGTSLTDKAFEKMPKDSPDWFNYTISGKSLFVDPQRNFDKANNPGVTMYTLVDGKAVVSSALTTYPDYHGVRQGALCCGDRKDRQDGKWNLYTIDEDGSIIEVDSLELDVFYVSTVVGFEVDASKKNSLKVLQERKRGAGTPRWHRVTIIAEAPTADEGEVPDLGHESAMAIFANDKSVDVWATMRFGNQPDRTVVASSGEEVDVPKIDVTLKPAGDDAHNYLSMNVLGLQVINNGRTFRLLVPGAGFDLRESPHTPGAIPKDKELGLGYGVQFWDDYKKTLRNYRGEAIQIEKKKYARGKKTPKEKKEATVVVATVQDGAEDATRKRKKKKTRKAQELEGAEDAARKTKKAKEKKEATVVVATVQDVSTVLAAQENVGDHRIKLTVARDVRKKNLLLVASHVPEEDVE
jgi:hypothetical protein